MRASWNTAAGASPTASRARVSPWHEYFRQDLARVDVPTLVIHGDNDRIVPFSVAGQRTAPLVKGARLVVVKGGPHCITWTKTGENECCLVNFLGKTRCGRLIGTELSERALKERLRCGRV